MKALLMNEWIKLYKRRSTWLMFILTIIVVVGFGWVNRTTEALGVSVEMTQWTFVNSAMYISSLVGLFSMIVAARIVSQEVQWGTMKLMLLRPFARWKFLLSKLLVVVFFSLIIMVLLVLTAILVGGIFFGFSSPMEEASWTMEGREYTTSILLLTTLTFLFKWLHMLTFSIISFVLSAITLSNAFSLGISLFLFFTGSSLTFFLAANYEWGKYILFANSDLTQYINGAALEGLTLVGSFVIVLIYLSLFLVSAFLVFQKRDVHA